MIRKKRAPREDDQEQIEKAFVLLNELVESHPEIEPAIWVSATRPCEVESYIVSGHSWEEWREDVLGALEHYKSWWKV